MSASDETTQPPKPPVLENVAAPGAKPETEKLEIRPLPTLAKMAMRELQKNLDKSRDEIILASIETLGLDIEKDGWRYDARRGAFVRPALVQGDQTDHK